MHREVKSILKKTAKIAGVTCIAAGAVAVLTSATAVKVVAEGGKYLANAVRKILREESAPEQTIVEAVAAEAVEAEVTAE